jgi:hypothetical protein
LTKSGVRPVRGVEESVPVEKYVEEYTNEGGGKPPFQTCELKGVE